MTSYCQPTAGDLKLREEIRVLVDSIIANNPTDYKIANRSNKPQYERFKKLQSAATDQELVILTDHRDVLIRSDAFLALAQRETTDVFPILLKHLSDTASVMIARGCIVEPETVGDYFLYVLSSEKEDTGRNKLTAGQRSLVDSILIYDKTNRLGTKYSLIAQMKPAPKYYERIREIAYSEKNRDALFALAKYKNKNDIPAVKQLFKKESDEFYGISAAIEFTDSSFYPYLVKIFKRDLNDEHYDGYKWELLYKALAKYPTKKTYTIFEKTLRIKDNYQYQESGERLLFAIQRYPNKIFEPLKAKVKLDAYHLEHLQDKLSEEHQ